MFFPGGLRKWKSWTHSHLIGERVTFFFRRWSQPFAGCCAAKAACLFHHAAQMQWASRLQLGPPPKIQLLCHFRVDYGPDSDHLILIKRMPGGRPFVHVALTLLVRHSGCTQAGQSWSSSWRVKDKINLLESCKCGKGENTPQECIWELIFLIYLEIPKVPAFHLESSWKYLVSLWLPLRPPQKPTYSLAFLASACESRFCRGPTPAQSSREELILHGPRRAAHGFAWHHGAEAGCRRVCPPPCQMAVPCLKMIFIHLATPPQKKNQQVRGTMLEDDLNIMQITPPPPPAKTTKRGAPSCSVALSLLCWVTFPSMKRVFLPGSQHKTG